MDPSWECSKKSTLEAIRGHLVDAIERGEESRGGSTWGDVLSFLESPKSSTSEDERKEESGCFCKSTLTKSLCVHCLWVFVCGLILCFFV